LTRPPTALKIPAIIDEFTKEVTAIKIHGPIDADHTVHVLETIVTVDRPTARAAQDGQRPRAHRQCAPGLVPLHQLHRAWQSLGEPVHRVVQGKLRDELLDGEIFESLLQTQVLAEVFRGHYK